MKKIIELSLDDIPIPKPAFSVLRKAGLSKSTKLVKLGGFLATLSLLALWALSINVTSVISETDLINFNPNSAVLKDPTYDEEILWFARLIYSETKNVNEQVLVAWVARNRVESGFRGNTYKEVALAPNQFSGLNSFDHNYELNVNLDFEDKVRGWDTAVEVAKLVYDAPSIMRPFPDTVTHFYSPIAVSAPKWTSGLEPIHEVKNHKGGVRFAFYSNVK